MRILSRLLPRGRSTSETVVAESAAGLSPSSASNRTVVANAAAHREAGRLGDALKATQAALAKYPANAELLFEHASTLFAWGRYAEAYRALRLAERAGLHNSVLYTKLGWTCLWLSRIDEAGEAMRGATEAAPDDWAGHFGRGAVLRVQKRSEEAKVAFERALALDPDNAQVTSSLVACEIALDRFESAERLARRATELHPNLPGAFADLGMALCSQERHDDAIAAFERAESLEISGRDMGEDVVNFAVCLLRAGRNGQALSMIERRLRDYPSTLLHAQYALALLIAGRLREGWDHFEYRWIDPPLLSARPNFVKPQWSGQDLRGKTILLWSEQGFGDFIHFIRYAAHVKALGATVVVLLRDELRELAERMPVIDRVLGPGEPYPPFDYYINLLSLPRVFGTDVESIPADIPYLSIDDVRDAKWRERLPSGETLKVGIVWAGSPTHSRDRFRSLPVASLAPLLRVPGVRFHSLQKGPAAAALTTADATVVDLGPELDSFADTAAAIAHLDLVIGVDTAVVHLAGALGKPVWTLVPIPPDWRWMEARDDTRWYPTMRLFRQRSQGDWDEVIDRVKSALESEVDQRAAARTPDVNVAHTRVPSPSTSAVPRTTEPTDGFCRVSETRHGIMQYFPDSEVGRSLAFYGEWRQLELDVLGRFVASGMTVLEAESGVGCTALWLSRRIGSEGHLFLYENDRIRRQLLEQNLKANGIDNATLIRRRLGRTGDDGSGDTIDELQLERLDWLKIAGGRYALDVLQGAEETLWRLRPRIAIDVSGIEGPADLVQQANDFGYACWRIETSLYNPANFNRRERALFGDRAAALVIALPEELGSASGLDGFQRLT
jgi:tetratricopeptide (TPR) repeat protein